MNTNDTQFAPAVCAAPASPVGAPSQRPRRRRWPLVLACVAVLAAIPVGAYVYIVWANENDLAAAVAETDALDPHWRLNDLVAQRPAIADDENPARVVLKVQDLLHPGVNLGDKNYRQFDDLPSVNELNAVQKAALKEALEKHQDALKLARTLKDFPKQGRFAVKVAPDWLTTNLEPLQRCRGVMHLLECDAKLRADEDDIAGALESCRGCLVAARSIGNEPYLIAALIRFAGQAITVNTLERVLAQSHGDNYADELKAIQDLIADEIDSTLFLEAMRGERAGSDSLVESLQQGSVKYSALFGGPQGSNWETWFIELFPVVITHGRPDYLRMLNKAVEAAKLPPEKQHDAFDTVERETRESKALLIRLLMPALSKVVQANIRSQANLRSAYVAVAAERYRLKYGYWPETLNDLVKDKLISAIPIDPYDGQPLRYKHLADGVVIYSVGHDKVDNGGNLNRGNYLAPGADQGFRLWDAQHRRRPALPPLPDDDPK